MNGKTHAKIGAVVGVTTSTIYLLNQTKHKEKLDWGDLGNIVLITSGCTLISLLPDILEPALNPRHRQFFHSMLIIGLLIYLSYKINDSNLCESDKTILLSFVMAYLSHLIADSTTPAGLPYVGEL